MMWVRETSLRSNGRAASCVVQDAQDSAPDDWMHTKPDHTSHLQAEFEQKARNLCMEFKGYTISFKAWGLEDTAEYIGKMLFSDRFVQVASKENRSLTTALQACSMFNRYLKAGIRRIVLPSSEKTSSSS